MPITIAIRKGMGIGSFLDGTLGLSASGMRCVFSFRGEGVAAGSGLAASFSLRSP
jgi:hypothetical protein